MSYVESGDLGAEPLVPLARLRCLFKRLDTTCPRERGGANGKLGAVTPSYANVLAIFASQKLVRSSYPSPFFIFASSR